VSAASVAALTENGAARRRSATSRTRIVVVDDHPITLAGLNFLLAADFTVPARCVDAHEALRAVRIYEPDVLIIDQDMPTIGGVDVLKQLRAAGDQTPVVLLATANNAQPMEDRVQAVRPEAPHPLCARRSRRAAMARRERQ